MTPTISPAAPTTQAQSHRDSRPSSPKVAGCPGRADADRRRLDRLGAYIDAGGRARDVIAVPRADGCVLIVDRDGVTLGDRRLVACIEADEPAENAALVCEMYLRDTYRGCRRVSVEDLRGAAIGSDPSGLPETQSRLESPPAAELTRRDRDGVVWSYRLEPVDVGGPEAELHWCRRVRGQSDTPSASVCLRDVVGALESYEPVCGLTLGACTDYRDDPLVRTDALLIQLARLRESPIVLNRGLREAVFRAGARGLSMSEIALRCGRTKHDGKGNRSGETSWLGRRVGVLPESGTDRPTPWVHSDVLALIARDGLGISPREVELG
jgi:hypothetical protein